MQTNECYIYFSMRVHLKNIKNNFSEEQVITIKNFIEYLQRELPLKDEININFTSSREPHMTTGLRMPPHELFVLSKNRMVIDVLRTLSHEWAHEFQHQKLGLKNDEKTPNIGGPVEDFANVVSGIMVKSFEKNNEGSKKVLYNEQVIQK